MGRLHSNKQMKTKSAEAKSGDRLLRNKTCRVCGHASPYAGWKNCGGCPVCFSRARERELANKPGCARCDRSGRTVLQWDEILKSGEHPLAKYRQYIIMKKRLRFGTLYGCSRCAAQWVLDDRSRNMIPVPKNRLELLSAWCDKPQSLPRGLLKKALAIGAVRYDDFYYTPFRMIPPDGEPLDHCVISFQAGPPIDDWRRNVRLASEIGDILPSPHALPRTVREATADNWDAPYSGYGGAIASTPENEYLHIHCGAQFTDLVGIDPRGLRLVKHPDKIPEKARIRQVPNRQNRITFFVADWVPELGSL